MVAPSLVEGRTGRSQPGSRKCVALFIVEE
jgi:hypothetical protein